MDKSMGTCQTDQHVKNPCKAYQYLKWKLPVDIHGYQSEYFWYLEIFSDIGRSSAGICV